jgi:FAD/FMN-containing dehydrogenase
MGGQQFAEGSLHLYTTSMARILGLDRDRGVATVEAGIQWPELVSGLLAMQADEERPWTIVQKQTGADRLSIGGALAANVHGRGLTWAPFVQDVEAFTLVDARGETVRCSRDANPELFSLAVGGYGLFGPVGEVELRLARRRKLRRVVETLAVDDLMSAFDDRIAGGFRYGDFQFAIDAASPGFLRRGVFSCYEPVDDSVEIPPSQNQLSPDDWRELHSLAHTDKGRAFDLNSQYYLGTSGQVYWSDLHQMSVYLDDYHLWLDEALATPRATEMISELYVPRPALARFMADVRQDFRRHSAEVIYGTVRLIERDTESLLAWAREPWACIVLKLHVVLGDAGTAAAAEHFRRLIDRAAEHGGSYFLTYHRWARRDQVERCHPRFRQFLNAKRRYDPDERFQSDWHRHYRAMFGT